MKFQKAGFVLGIGLFFGAGLGRAAETMSFAKFAELESEIRIENVADALCGANCQSLRQEFRYVVYVGKQIYCYWDLKRAETQIDYDQFATRLENTIVDDTSPTDYYVLLRQWASAFHDGHVNVLAKDDRSDLETYTTPLRLEVFGAATAKEKVGIVEVGADTLDLKVGDQVLEIDGVPIQKALDAAETAVSGSTRKMRRFFSTRRLVDVMGAKRGAVPLTVTVRRGADTLSRTLLRNVEVAAKPPASGAAGAATSGAELIKAQILPGGVGYLRIDGFAGEQSFFLLDQAMRKLSGARGFLFDLRKNGGGDQSGNSILARLISRTITRYRTSERMDNFVISARPNYFLLKWTAGTPFAEWHDLQVEPATGTGSSVGKPVVALVGPNCFSACDTFTAGLKANGLATVVGENTGGGTGTPLVFELPVSRHSFRYSVVRGLTAQGAAIEGVGTAPDVELEATLDERVGKRDDQLAGALRIIQSKFGGVDGPKPEALSESVLSSFGATWLQGFEISPSTREDLELKRLSQRDEL